MSAATLQSFLLSGPPRVMGQAYGEAFRGGIQRIADIRYDELLVRDFLKDHGEPMVRALAERQIQVLARNPAYHDAYQFFLGIVEGSGLPAHRVMAMQNYTDIRDGGFVSFEELERALGKSVPRVGEGNGTGATDRDAGGCSAWRVCHSGGAVDVGGQTWDMHATAKDSVILLEIEGQDGLPDIKALTLMGCPPLCGVNSAGVLVMINNVFSTRVNVDGLPWPYLVHTMLQQPTPEAARDYLKRNLPMSTHNYMAVGRRLVFNVEATGFESVETHHLVGDGEVHHTNHCLRSELAATQPQGRKSGTSEARFAALEDYLGGDRYQAVASNDALAADVLFDGARASVNVPRPATLPHAPMTCGGLLVDFVTREARFFQGPYGEGVHLDRHF